MPTSAGGTDPAAVLEWPTAHSTYYAWWWLDLPPGYQANAALGYIIASRSTDSTHAAIVTLSWACIDAASVDAPTWTATAPVNITGAPASARVLTTGSITPTCAAGQTAGIKLLADTATNSLTQPFDLVSLTLTTP